MNTYPNTLTNEFLNNLILSDWQNNTVCADIEESVDSIKDFIVFKNHGDDYVLVHTDDCWYEYRYLDNARQKSNVEESEEGVETVVVWYHDGINMNVALVVDDEYYSGIEFDDEDISRDEWGSCTWWVTPNALVNKLTLMSDVFVPDIAIAAQYDVISNLRSKIRVLEKDLSEAESSLQIAIRKAQEVNPDVDYEIFGDKIISVKRAGE